MIYDHTLYNERFSLTHTIPSIATTLPDSVSYHPHSNINRLTLCTWLSKFYFVYIFLLQEPPILICMKTSSDKIYEVSLGWNVCHAIHIRLQRHMGMQTAGSQVMTWWLLPTKLTATDNWENSGFGLRNASCESVLSFGTVWNWTVRLMFRRKTLLPCLGFKRAWWVRAVILQLDRTYLTHGRGTDATCQQRK